MIVVVGVECIWWLVTVISMKSNNGIDFSLKEYVMSEVHLLGQGRTKMVRINKEKN